MLKSRIARRLSGYFMIALLLFALVLGGIFILLFRNHTLNLFKEDQQRRAERIAATLAEYCCEESGMMGSYTSGEKGSGKNGFGAYMRFIGDMAGSDVWVVDENYQLLTTGHNMMSYQYSELPENASEVIDEVFAGKTSFSKSFSSVLDEMTLTVGVPIVTSGGATAGVVLMHAPVYGIDQASFQGAMILVLSVAAALVIAVGLGVGLSVSFTKPLNIMKKNALWLVGDLLDLSRLQNTEFAIEKREVDLCDLIPDVIRSARQLACKKKIELVVPNHVMDKIIQGDYSRLRQMIMIVLDNAVKFTPRGEKIWIDITDDKISIIDSGKGIAPEQLPHIFDRFYKTYGEQNKTGTGLGLAIAKQIAVRHGIELQAKNSKEHGAEFNFLLLNEKNF